MPVNDTVRRFGFPDTLIAEYDHWLVLLRPSQPTVGSVILAAKGDATAFGDLADGAHAELQQVTKAIEKALNEVVRYERINYLMLMMVDPHVHFHVIPRYDGERQIGQLAIADSGWPGPPDLKGAAPLDPKQLAGLAKRLRREFAETE